MKYKQPKQYKIPAAFSLVLLSANLYIAASVIAEASENQSPFPVPSAVSAEGQTEPSVIDHETNAIFIPVPYYTIDGTVYPLSDTRIKQVEFSSDAVHTLPPLIDLRTQTFFTIESPSGEKQEWSITGGYQLPDSDFSEWHTERVSGFITIGTTECDQMVGAEGQTIWDSGNPAYAASGSKNWPTKKIRMADGTFAAELTTRSILGIIASGNLFTGRIERNMSLSQLLGFTDKDGKALIDWGVPFEGRPKGFRVKFKYDGKGDDCTIMATLENRNTDTRKFIGTALYTAKTDDDRSGEGIISLSEPDENGLRTLEAAFMYGIYPGNATPMQEGAVQGTADEQITHVNVVFASSARGDYFKGVKGAQLIIKDFEFIY